MNGLWPKDEVVVADERSTLLAFLGHQRDFLLRKAEGLTDPQAAAVRLFRRTQRVGRGVRSARQRKGQP